MAIVVNTYASESTLQTAIGGAVTTYASETALETGIAGATSVFGVVDKGIYFTLIDNPSLANIVSITGKGIFYTVTSGVA